MIRRIYVEKKPGFDVEAAALFNDIKKNIAPGIKALRVINRYDADGVGSDADWENCVNAVFSEPAVDKASTELELNKNTFAVTSAYLPGQYDQRADSAVQCIQVITGLEDVIVETARVYLLEGSFTDGEKIGIRRNFINPVDSFEAPSAMPQKLGISAGNPPPVPVVKGFVSMSDGEVADYLSGMGFAMNVDDLICCREYFAKENRDPTLTELKVLDTYWSDHCRHTTFTTRLGDISFDGKDTNVFKEAYEQYLAERKKLYGEKDRPITLMDIATMGMKVLKARGKLNDLDASEEINACSIVIPVDTDGVTEEWLLQFKNETHNHPTEIEPFGGAATCLGGAIRDPLSGRAYIYQAMRVTGSGDPTVPQSETWHGKLPQRTITAKAAHGYSSYGNQIGLATGHVSEVYHPGYTAKRLEIGAVIGAVKRENVRRETPLPGDVVLLIGGRTGRDGCGGATGSSKGHTEDSLAECGAEVQKGNPITERKLQRLFRNPKASRLIKRCNDFGAGGVCVAVGELADGLRINLDAVPKKYAGLDGTELAISESQERMAAVVSPEDADAMKALAEAENLECTCIAAVTDDGRMKMIWQNETVVDISREFIDSNGAPRFAEICVSKHSSDISRPAAPGCVSADAWLSHLKSLNIASQKGLADRFDSSIGAGTVLFPFAGKHRLTPSQAMAAKIPTGGETETVSLMAYGFDPYMSEVSPFHGAVSSVVESLAKIVAVGGSYKNARLTFQEYFERLGSDPSRWQKPFLALLGAFKAQLEMETPAIGGKDSMSGSYEDRDVPPTLVSFAVQTAKAREIISQEFKAAGHKIVHIKAEYTPDGLPNFSLLKKSFETVAGLFKEGKIYAAYALNSGGIAEALTKMCFGNNIGCALSFYGELFNSKAGSFLLEADEGIETDLNEFTYDILGETVEDAAVTLNGTRIPLVDCRGAWLSTLEDVFPTRRLDGAASEDIAVPLSNCTDKKFSASVKTSRPRVFMPVFPGSNCEYDTARAFEKAGAEVDMLVIRNLTLKDLEASLSEMEKRIKRSNILSLVGGFSAGDEPDGSSKFITAMFRSPRVTDAVHGMLASGNFLMLGICNGFQALLKSGLIQYGEIRPMAADAPTLTHNVIGRHVSDLVITKIISNNSPWLMNVKPGDLHLIPVSHGEGRFMASDEDVKRMVANSQIATQYADEHGCPSMDISHNPNGSMLAVEGLISPGGGYIFGKMGHSERIGKDLYKGFNMNMDQKIFESGVKYFA